MLTSASAFGAKKRLSRAMVVSDAYRHLSVFYLPSDSESTAMSCQSTFRACACCECCLLYSLPLGVTHISQHPTNDVSQQTFAQLAASALCTGGNDSESVVLHPLLRLMESEIASLLNKHAGRLRQLTKLSLPPRSPRVLAILASDPVDFAFSAMSYVKDICY